MMKSQVELIRRLYVWMMSGNVEPELCEDDLKGIRLFFSPVSHPSGEHGLCAEILFGVPGYEANLRSVRLRIYDPKYNVPDKPGLVYLEYIGVEIESDTTLPPIQIYYPCSTGLDGVSLAVRDIVAQHFTECVRQAH
jgi:hypothetical protein